MMKYARATEFQPPLLSSEATCNPTSIELRPVQFTEARTRKSRSLCNSPSRSMRSQAAVTMVSPRSQPSAWL